MMQTFANLPLYFEVNQGQTNSSVKFLSRGSGYNLFLTPTSAVLGLHKNKSQEEKLTMELVKANPNPQIGGFEELPGKANYFSGKDANKWRTNIPTYVKVKYQNVYPGTDLIYYGNNGKLEYDFILAPLSNPENISFAIEGADKLEVNSQGELVLSMAGEQIQMHKPLIYQEANGIKQNISGGYEIKDNNQIAFKVGNYDNSKELIIDPVLEYSTYLGGSDFDQGLSIAIDASGSAYIAGSTYSSSFPITNSFSSGGTTGSFVSKLSNDGSTLIYSTYIANGGQASGVAVDASGDVYITGPTDSTFPTTTGAFQTTFGGSSDSYITKLDSTGSNLIYSTFLGGNNSDTTTGIVLDNNGNAYVTGCTNSTNFPTLNPIQSTHGTGSNCDAFVTEMNSSGSALIYSTYIGGNGEDQGTSIALDSSNNIYITGLTQSTNFPVVNALQSTNLAQNNSIPNAFVTKINSTGSSFIYSTYLGVSDGTEGWGIAADNSGNAYITGDTASGFPTVNPIQSSINGNTDAFIAKLNSSGSSLVYSTYLGGAGTEIGFGIAVDSDGNVYVTGDTNSTDFPLTNPLQTILGGSFDSFITKINSAGSGIVYSTYLGGSGAEDQSHIAVDSNHHNAFVTGVTGSNDFPTVNAYDSSYGGNQDAFVTKISEISQITALTPAQVWVGLKNSDDVGLKFDLLAEVYKDATLVSSGQTNSVSGGSSGFNNAVLDSIPFNTFSPLSFPAGSALKLKLYVRNACSGSAHNSGTARLWFNDSAANSQFGATIGSSSDNYFLLNNFILATAAGGGPKKTIDVAAGARCSSFKPFGTWSITL